MNGRPLALALFLLVAAVVGAPSVSAHLGRDDGFALAPGQDTLVDLLSAMALAVVSAAGLAYIGRRALRGEAPDARWGLAGLGVAWVASPAIAPRDIIFEDSWTLVAAALVFGTLALAWLSVVRAARPAWNALRARPRLFLAGGAASLVFLALFAFGTHIIIIPEPHEAGLADGTGFVVAYETFGPLAVWPDVEFFWPEANLGGHVTPASAAIALSLSAFLGLAVALLLLSFATGSVRAIAGSGGTAMATNLCACCTPILYPVLVAVLGSGAAPIVYALGDPDLSLYNAAQVANVWLMTAAVVLAARPWRAAACAPGAGGAPAGTEAATQP